MHNDWSKKSREVPQISLVACHSLPSRHAAPQDFDLPERLLKVFCYIGQVLSF
jgi:hypothetical protein